MIFIFFAKLEEDVDYYLTQFTYLLWILIANDLLWFLFNVYLL